MGNNIKAFREELVTEILGFIDVLGASDRTKNVVKYAVEVTCDRVVKEINRDLNGVVNLINEEMTTDIQETLKKFISENKESETESKVANVDLSIGDSDQKFDIIIDYDLIKPAKSLCDKLMSRSEARCLIMKECELSVEFRLNKIGDQACYCNPELGTTVTVKRVQ